MFTVKIHKDPAKRNQFDVISKSFLIFKCAENILFRKRDQFLVFIQDKDKIFQGFWDGTWKSQTFHPKATFNCQLSCSKLLWSQYLFENFIWSTEILTKAMWPTDFQYLQKSKVKTTKQGLSLKHISSLIQTLERPYVEITLLQWP